MTLMAQGTLTARRLSAMLQEGRTRMHAVREILRAFEACEGNALHAAKRLGISHRALLRWMVDYPQLEEAIGRLRARHEHRHRI
jgi:transcriptional regulator with PAS, ATPase and Fis domain